MNGKTTSEIIAGLVLGVLVVFGLVLAFSPFFISGCAFAPVYPPTTHEEWGAYCMSKEGPEFGACLKEWNEWKE